MRSARQSSNADTTASAVSLSRVALEPGGDVGQIGDEFLHRRFPLRLIPRAQNRRGMRGHGDELGEIGLDRTPTVTADSDMRTEQRLTGCRPEANECFGADHFELSLEPRQARAHLPAVGLLVDPPLTAGLVAEVLDGVGDVHLLAGDPGALEALVEHSAGRSDERMTLDVLSIPGLLSDQHEPGATGTLAHHTLRRTLPQIAGPAFLYCASHIREAGPLGHRRQGTIRGCIEQSAHRTPAVIPEQ
jgi:hypothetical protein